VCAHGRDLAARGEWSPEATWSKGRYRFFSDSIPRQRQAMRRYDLVRLRERREQPTPLAEVASLSPTEPVTPELVRDAGA
jgi:hypothetical protein